MMIILLLMGVPLSVAQFSLSQQDCGFTQQQAFECMLQKVDTDRNGGVSRAEMDAAISKSGSKLFRVFGWLRGSTLIFGQCDYDKNGEITARDMKLSVDTCFHNDLLRCGMKHLCGEK